MRKQAIRWGVWLLALGLLALVIRLVPLRETWAVLQQLSLVEVGWLLLANGLVLLTLNGRWYFILRGQAQNIPFLPLLGYRIAAFGLSYFTPGPQFGGEPLQVYLVETRHHVPRPVAIAAMTIDKLLELLVNFTFLFGGILVVLQGRLLPNVGGGALIFGLILMSLPIAFLLAYGLRRKPISWLLQKIGAWQLWQTRPVWQKQLRTILDTTQSSEQATTQFFHTAPRFFLLALTASILSWALMIGEYWLMVRFLGVSLSLVELVTALTAVRIAFLLFLPAGLGALEASQMLAFSALGLNPAVGISASLLIRARDTLLGGLGLLLGSNFLQRKQLPGLSTNQVDNKHN